VRGFLFLLPDRGRRSIPDGLGLYFWQATCPSIVPFRMKIEIPVVDLFAGPGGLGEGFSRYGDYFGDDISFRTRLSIEKDNVAARTLRLRAFVRAFSGQTIPDCYYNYARRQGEMGPRDGGPSPVEDC